MSARREVFFDSDGVRCAADLYLPAEPAAALPCVVMAHGGSGTKRLGLAADAEKFAGSGIGVDERAREHATMLAFGFPPRTVLGMTTQETVLIGAAGTLLGVLGGYGLLRWLTAVTIPSVLPELGVTAALSTQTIVGALVLGVLTVALAPLFTLRRTRRMDIAATLRVTE
jgi:hypothetical protein